MGGDASENYVIRLGIRDHLKKGRSLKTSERMSLHQTFPTTKWDRKLPVTKVKRRYTRSKGRRRSTGYAYVVDGHGAFRSSGGPSECSSRRGGVFICTKKRNLQGKGRLGNDLVAGNTASGTLKRSEGIKTYYSHQEVKGDCDMLESVITVSP